MKKYEIETEFGAIVMVLYITDSMRMRQVSTEEKNKDIEPTL